MCDISRKRVIDRANPAILHRGAHPGIVNKSAIRAHADDLSIERLELTDTMGEAQDLRRTHEGEVTGVEKEYQPLPTVLFQGKALVAAGIHAECRGMHTDQGTRGN